MLHPTILQRLPAEPKVAELAAGTGAFLVDLAKELPHLAQLDAYDISDDAFLLANELPRNVTLNVMDSRDAAPLELHGRYDVVCIRMLTAALQPPDWLKVASHAVQLLKPSGSLQWIEGNPLQLQTGFRTGPLVKTSALEKGFHQALSKPTHLDWFVSNLPDVLEAAGFRDVEHQVTSLDRLPEDRKDKGVICIGAAYSILRKQAHSGQPGMLTMIEVDSLYEEMRQEIEGGAYSRMDM